MEVASGRATCPRALRMAGADASWRAGPGTAGGGARRPGGRSFRRLDAWSGRIPAAAAGPTRPRFVPPGRLRDGRCASPLRIPADAPSRPGSSGARATRHLVRAVVHDMQGTGSALHARHGQVNAVEILGDPSVGMSPSTPQGQLVPASGRQRPCSRVSDRRDRSHRRCVTEHQRGRVPRAPALAGAEKRDRQVTTSGPAMRLGPWLRGQPTHRARSALGRRRRPRATREGRARRRRAPMACAPGRRPQPRGRASMAAPGPPRSCDPATVRAMDVRSAGAP